MSRPRNLESLLSSGLGGVVDRAKALIRVEKQLHNRLDAKLASHCRLANVEGRILTLQVDSPAWAGRLRQQAPKLLPELRRIEGLASIDQIRVTVRPSEHRIPRSQPKAHLSAKSASAIEAAAETIGDEALGAALKRLAGRADR